MLLRGTMRCTAAVSYTTAPRHLHLRCSVVDWSDNHRLSSLSAVNIRFSIMTNVTPPMIIGGLAVLTTAIAVMLVVSGLWTIITGREIVWKISPRLNVAGVVWITIYLRLRGKSMAQIGVKLLVRHLSTGRKMFGGRRPQHARASMIAREFLTTMLPMPETPAPRRANRAQPPFSQAHRPYSR